MWLLDGTDFGIRISGTGDGLNVRAVVKGESQVSAKHELPSGAIY